MEPVRGQRPLAERPPSGHTGGPGPTHAPPLPRPPGLRRSLFGASVLLIVVVVGISGAYLERQLRAWLHTSAEAELLRHARAVEAALDPLGLDSRARSWDPLADRLGAALDLHVTLIGSDGSVMGDSELSATQLAAQRSQEEHPEVRAARASGLGSARRYSSTLDTDMLYMAVPLQAGGVVRVARRLEEVDQAVRRMRLLLGVAGLIALCTAMGIGAVAAHLMERTLRSVVANAQRAAAGGAAVAHRPRSAPAVRGSYQQMATQLQGTISTLAAERDRFGGVLAAMSEALLVLDEEQQVALVNPAALQLFGLERLPEDVSLLELARAPALHALVLAAAGGTAGVDEVEVGHPSPRRLLAHAAPLSGGEGVVLVMHDVTELRRLETVRRDFVANVSHELRTPLSVIRANAETLLDGALEEPAPARRFVGAVLRNAERLGSLVADLLDLSRLEAGRYTMQLGAVPVEPVVAEVIEALRASGEAKEMRLQARVAPGLRVWADAQALQQVLNNLVDNALKYGLRGGLVQVEAEQSGGEVQLEVSDDGPGIEPRHRERIFERFYRVDRGRSRELGGTGLGLSIVRHLVRSMGGQVAVVANERRGTTFRVKLAPAPGEQT